MARQLFSNVRLKTTNLFPVLVVFGFFGALLLIRSFAATGEVVAFESEDGTVSGAAAIVSDATASGGRYAVLHTITPAPPTTPPVTPPSPTPSPVPSPTPAANPSGEAMPVGDLPGWKQIFADDFKTNATVGNFPGTAYKNTWGVYPDGWEDTAGKSEAGQGRYYPSKVLSVNSGVLNMYLHTENNIHMVAAPVPILPGATGSGGGQLYGRYTVRFKADAVKGYKTAWLLWPDSGTWPRDGEIDFPEGNLDDVMSAFMHRQNGANGGDQDYYGSNAIYTSWHTATTEWGPNKLSFILDGKVLGTSTSRVPNTPMHWVIQTETCIGGCQPTASAAGNVQLDWVAVYKYQP